MEPFETIETDEMVVACNGGAGPLGHPRIYMNLAASGRAECPYCSRLYVNRFSSGHAVSGVTTPSGQGIGQESPDEHPAPRQPGL